jgi:hypothetical protein
LAESSASPQIAEGIPAPNSRHPVSINLSINLRPPAPPKSWIQQLESPKAQLVYSCRVNSPTHNPSGRGFEPHPPHLGTKYQVRAMITKTVMALRFFGLAAA